MRPERDYAHRTLIEKLGVKEGHRVSVLGIDDPGFLDELRAAGADVSVGRRRKESDHLFLGLKSTRDLPKMRELEPWMTRNGAAWVVYPKGRKDLREADVIREGVAAGLVDNKVASFSHTHTALRFVIPLARR